jgi:hypothetical protein
MSMPEPNSQGSGTTTVGSVDYDSDEEEHYREADNLLRQAFHRQFNEPRESTHRGQYIHDEASQAKINACIEKKKDQNYINFIRSIDEKISNVQGDPTKLARFTEMKERHEKNIKTTCIAEVQMEKFLEKERQREIAISQKIFGTDGTELGGSRRRRRTKRRRAKRRKTIKRMKRKSSKRRRKQI